MDFGDSNVGRMCEVSVRGSLHSSGAVPWIEKLVHVGCEITTCLITGMSGCERL